MQIFLADIRNCCNKEGWKPSAENTHTEKSSFTGQGIRDQCFASALDIIRAMQEPEFPSQRQSRILNLSTLDQNRMFIFRIIHTNVFD